MEHSECPFCKFDEPNVTVYADDLVLAILSRAPVNRYHVMVLPRVHIEHLSEVPALTADPGPEDRAGYARAVRACLPLGAS